MSGVPLYEIPTSRFLPCFLNLTPPEQPHTKPSDLVPFVSNKATTRVPRS